MCSWAAIWHFIEDAMRRDTAAPRFVQVPFRGMRFLAVGGIIWNVVSCFEFSIFVCVPCSVLVLGGPWRFLVVELLSLARQSRNPATALWTTCTKILDVCKTCVGSIIKYKKLRGEIPKWENRSLEWANVNQMAPNRSQKVPKGSQKGTKWSPKGAKGRPKFIKK